MTHGKLEENAFARQGMSNGSRVGRDVHSIGVVSHKVFRRVENVKFHSQHLKL